MAKIKLTDGKEYVLPTDKKAASRILADAIMNNGRIVGEDSPMDYNDAIQALRPNMKDAVGVSDIRPLLQTSIEIIMREPVEPLMVIHQLFTPVMAKGMETRILAGAIGGVVAADIPETGSYPEVFFQLGNGFRTAYVGKCGIAASFTDEALRYSTWDIMAINLRLMRNALVRHKEQKAVGFLRQLGKTLFDNASPTSSLFGVTTGRALDMSANGTFTMDDLLKALAHMQEVGYPADTMLVNPIMFLQFSQDPVLRNLFATGNGGSYFQPYSGNPGPLAPFSQGSMGGMGMSNANTVVPYGNAAGETPTSLDERAHGMNSVFQLPSYFGWRLNIIPSSSVPYDETSGLTDIYLIKSGEVGFLFTDEDMVQVEWRDENTETVKVKLRERYGFGVKNEGHGIGVMRNIKVGRNYWDGILRTVSSEPVAEIDSTTAIV